MWCQNNKEMGCEHHLMRAGRLASGLTLVELIIALAIVTIVFGAMLPQVRAIQNSWDSRAGASEILQNGRVLTDHINRRLSRAARILAVSDSAETNGFIEFEDNDGNNFRYDINSTTGYVEFGPVGSLADLAGPVSELLFTCYNATDLDTPVTNADAIRSVQVRAVLANAGGLDKDMTFTSQVYIRTNTLPAAGGDISKMSDPWLRFDPTMGTEPALVHMSGTKYLCAYRGDRDDGYACTLNVNPANWSVSSGSVIEYDLKQGITPELAKIYDNYVLCAYQGNRGGGFACILFEQMAGILQRNVPLQFELGNCIYPALSKMDTEGSAHRFLCVYFDDASSVRMVVLEATVTDVLTDITSGPTTSFGCDLVCQPALIRIDDTHHLCAYRGSNLRHWAVVLTVDPAILTVSAGTPFEVTPTIYAYEPDLAQIDDTHYLYALHSNMSQAMAVVLTVNTSDWTITNDTAYSYYQFSDAAGSLELCQIDATNFLCAYGGGGSDGMATVLTINPGDWSISHKPALTFETDVCAQPVLCQIDVGHYLCAHGGSLDDGYAGVLELGSPILP
jgi:type II secretory pathway pseudopilin PulG